MIVIPARAAVTVLVLALAACTYRPGADNPVANSLTWFSYVGASDIRADCQPGAADRLRLIYNGDYDEQVRTYDITVLAADNSSVGGTLEVRVRVPEDLSPGIVLSNLIGPTQAKRQPVRIGPNELADLRRALGDSGLARPAPDGLRLDSNEFYWLASVCIDGRFMVNAWKYPSPRFEALGFPAVLLRLDPTGIALNPPQPAYPLPERFNDRFAEPRFEFQVRGDRLLGSGAAFGN